MSDLDPVDEMIDVLRETLRANDLTLWSASGAHVFNGETALDGVARGLLARKVAEPSRTLAARDRPGLDVARRKIEALAWSPSSFDAITDGTATINRRDVLDILAQQREGAAYSPPTSTVEGSGR